MTVEHVMERGQDLEDLFTGDTLKDMYVYVDVAEGGSLRLGIRADARQSDGTRHSEYKNGWFKVDYFRINKVETTGISLNPSPSLPQGEGAVYDLQGRKIMNNSQLKKGIYIFNGKKIIK